MIFVTIGTHNQQFTRLIKRLDDIAAGLKEKIIVQSGHTKYIPKNCESFQWDYNLDSYYKKARLVISHGGSSVWEFAYKYKKPLIIVPRLYKYKEHINDHQLEFAFEFSKRTGVKTIVNINEITPSLLRSYKRFANIDNTNLKRLQEYLRNIINNVKTDKVIEKFE